MTDDDKSRDAIYIDALHELVNEQADRIEKLEAALREIAQGKYETLDVGWYTADQAIIIARKALEGKDG